MSLLLENININHLDSGFFVSLSQFFIRLINIHQALRGRAHTLSLQHDGCFLPDRLKFINRMFSLAVLEECRERRKIKLTRKLSELHTLSLSLRASINQFAWNQAGAILLFSRLLRLSHRQERKSVRVVRERERFADENLRMRENMKNTTWRYVESSFTSSAYVHTPSNMRTFSLLQQWARNMYISLLNWLSALCSQQQQSQRYAVEDSISR